MVLYVEVVLLVESVSFVIHFYCFLCRSCMVRIQKLASNFQMNEKEVTEEKCASGLVLIQCALSQSKCAI